MHPTEPFIDIHCHLLPGIDDGPRSWDESLEMAKMAVENGISTIVATPHQGGTFAHNTVDAICLRVAEFQRQLQDAGIELSVLPGADVRFDQKMLADIAKRSILTLADQRKHILIDLPHERYLPLEPLIEELRHAGIAVVLSHPERNQGLIKHRAWIEPLVNQGCLMQLTSGSLLGTFGPQCQDLAVWMLGQGFAHFVATDAHGMHSRRPLLRRAYERVAELVGRDEALELCCRNPARVIAGAEITPGRRQVRVHGSRWFRWKSAA